MGTRVTITFVTNLPTAMMRSWVDELGLLDPRKMEELEIEQLEVEARPEAADSSREE